MEQNLTTMLNELTSIGPHLDGSNVHTLDDPELLKFPVAYLSEPGYWYPDASRKCSGCATYLAKGGFLIVDDFHFAERVGGVRARRCGGCCPTRGSSGSTSRIRCSTASSQIKSLDGAVPGRLGEQGLMGEFFGIHEDNDPDASG